MEHASLLDPMVKISTCYYTYIRKFPFIYLLYPSCYEIVKNKSKTGLKFITSKKKLQGIFAETFHDYEVGDEKSSIQSRKM